MNEPNAASGQCKHKFLLPLPDMPGAPVSTASNWEKCIGAYRRLVAIDPKVYYKCLHEEAHLSTAYTHLLILL